MNYSVASVSGAGARSSNEDSIGVLRTQGILGVVVADGLGGMGGGERASQIAVSEFESFLERNTRPDIASLRSTALDIHRKIRQEQRLTDFKSMATTFTAGVFYETRLLIAHSGDSRISLARGSGIKRLTRDHSEAQRLLEAGKLDRAQYIDYPRKNILESALGIEGTPMIDTIDYEVKHGDWVFVTSDGVHNIVLLREFRKLVDECIDPERVVLEIKSLIEERGPEDNYSLIAVFVR
jgi:protein phosphatase